MPIIQVDHLTKEYRLGAMQGLKQTLLKSAARLTGKKVEAPPLFKALDDVSFSIEPGEVVGIIGHNGAGKSTLLKMLAKISTPTRGSIKVDGRIAPLIEVGAGFVPDFTGRENVYLNGAVLGMSRQVIDKKFDEIVSFAEMEEFIDTPVKRYSSGMKVKLAFAVATSIEAEILIVDEVLAVGDLAFQRKCFDRMEDLIKRQGKTVLLVSHNIRQVERLCSRVILMNHGKISLDGEADKVCTEFYKYSNEKTKETVIRQNKSKVRIKGSGEIELESIEIIDKNDLSIDAVPSGEPLNVRLRLRFDKQILKPEIIVGTHTTDFVYLTANTTAAIDNRENLGPGEYVINCKLPFFSLAPGVYCIRVAVFDQHRRLIFTGETLKVFSVLASENEGKQAPLRLIDTPSEWSINQVMFNPEQDLAVKISS